VIVTVTTLVTDPDRNVLQDHKTIVGFKRFSINHSLLDHSIAIFASVSIHLTIRVMSIDYVELYASDL